MPSVRLKGVIRRKGGAGSGNYGHAGRPGKVGGSAPSKGGFGSGTAPELHGGWEVIRSTYAGGGPLASRLREDDRAHAFMDDGVRNWGDVEDPAWILADGTTRSNVKESIVDELSERSGVDKSVVNEIVGQWSSSSNDSKVGSLSLQEAMSEEFGVPLSDWQKEQIGKFGDMSYMSVWKNRYAQLQTEIRDYTNWLVDQKNKLIARGVDNPVTRASLQEIRDTAYKLKWEELKRDIGDEDNTYMAITDRDNERKVIRAMYDYTQEKMAAFGFKPDDKITLWRGVSQIDFGEQYDTVDYFGNSMESWSAGYRVARGFGYKGDILAMDVPVRNILGTAKTGFGSLPEGEYVIFGNIPGNKAVIEK